MPTRPESPQYISPFIRTGSTRAPLPNPRRHVAPPRRLPARRSVTVAAPVSAQRKSTLPTAQAAAAAIIAKSGGATRINAATRLPERTAGVDNSVMSDAEKIAAGIIDPQTAAINRAIAKMQQEEEGRARAYAGISQALNAYGAGIPESIRAAYQGSADRVAGYAGGMTGALRDTSASAASEAAARIAAIAPGGAGMGPSEAPAAANVAYYTGGYLPASDLAAEAASRFAEAQTNRMAGGIRLAEQTTQSMRELQDDIAELRAKGLDIENTRPAEIAKALSSLKEEQRQERAFQLQLGQFQLSVAKTAWDQAEAMTNLTGFIHQVRNGKVVRTNQPATGSRAYTAAQSAAAPGVRAATAAAKPNAALSKVYGYLVDGNGNAIMQGGRRVPVAKGAAGAVKPQTKSVILGRAQKTGATAAQQLKERIWGNLEGVPNKGDEGYDKKYAAAQKAFKERLLQNRGAAMRDVMNAVGPHLRALGYTSDQIKAYAARIVDPIFK